MKSRTPGFVYGLLGLFAGLALAPLLDPSAPGGASPGLPSARAGDPVPVEVGKTFVTSSEDGKQATLWTYRLVNGKGHLRGQTFKSDAE